MNISNSNINTIVSEDIKEIVKAIDVVSKKLSLDFYLIGARARDFWFDKIKINPVRRTLDIDFAVLVPTVEKFELFKNELITHHGFIQKEGIPHQLIFLKNEMIVDLLPFGDIGISEYVNLTNSTIISIIGFKEVYQETLELGSVDEDLKIASLAGLCILKLIAWDDKKNLRTKDLDDFSIILKYYFEFSQEEIFESHLDLIEELKETELVGARVLGINMNNIIQKNSKLRERIIHILNGNVDDLYNSPIGDRIAVLLHKPISNAVELIKQVMAGLLD